MTCSATRTRSVNFCISREGLVKGKYDRTLVFQWATMLAMLSCSLIFSWLERSFMLSRPTSRFISLNTSGSSTDLIMFDLESKEFIRFVSSLSVTGASAVSEAKGLQTTNGRLPGLGGSAATGTWTVGLPPPSPL